MPLRIVRGQGRSASSGYRSAAAIPGPPRLLPVTGWERPGTRLSVSRWEGVLRKRGGDLERDLTVLGEGDRGLIAVVEFPVDVRRHRTRKSCRVGARERLSPELEELTQREALLGGRLYVDDPGSIMRVDPIETASSGLSDAWKPVSRRGLRP